MKNSFNNLAPNKIIFLLKILAVLLILPFAFSFFYSGYQIKNSDNISVYSEKFNLNESETYNYNFEVSDSESAIDNLYQSFSQVIAAQSEKVLQAVTEPTTTAPTSVP
ncbi:MAG TPA: hypothetical protein VJC17_00495, partial [Candidatus Dojkabacteria bacterium]|nr:hypothetical protein [Candidatus Dojkabacteria bacterium]